MTRVLALLLLAAPLAHAQTDAAEAARAASLALFGTACDDADALLSAVLAAGALGAVEVVASAERAVAVRDGEGLVAFNAGAAPTFLSLGDTLPAPLVPVRASRDAGRIPSLVALVGDDGAVFGLRVPPHATVWYRPAAPADVRPRGLDESPSPRP